MWRVEEEECWGLPANADAWRHFMPEPELCCDYWIRQVLCAQTTPIFIQHRPPPSLSLSLLLSLSAPRHASVLGVSLLFRPEPCAAAAAAAAAIVSKGTIPWIRAYWIEKLTT